MLRIHSLVATISFQPQFSWFFQSTNWTEILANINNYIQHDISKRLLLKKLKQPKIILLSSDWSICIYLYSLLSRSANNKNLLLLSLVLERIVNHQFKAYLQDHNLLPEYHSAYRKGYSTRQTSLRFFWSCWPVNDIEKGEFALLSLIDILAAFDTVDHEIVISYFHDQWCGTILVSITLGETYIIYSFIIRLNSPLLHTVSLWCTTRLEIFVDNGWVSPVTVELAQFWTGCIGFMCHNEFCSSTLQMRHSTAWPPNYLCSYCCVRQRRDDLSLHSAIWDSLVISETKAKSGGCLIEMTRPKVWESLPDSVELNSFIFSTHRHL